MRILIHDYAGHPFQIQLSRELANKGHEVVHGYAGGLVTPRGDLNLKQNDPKGLKFREYPMSPDYIHHKYNFIRRYRYEALYGKGVAEDIRSYRPELVVSGNAPSQVQLNLARVSRKIGAHFVTWVQDFYGIAVEKLARKKYLWLGALAGAWFRRLDRKVFKISTGAIAITEDFVPLMQAAGMSSDRILVLPNWAPLIEIAVENRDNIWSRRINVVNGFNFIYTGTLAMKHNPATLLELALHYREFSDVRVIVISEGPGSAWLLSQRERFGLDNLVLLPFQNFSEMSQVMGSANVLIAILEEEAGVFSVPSKVLTYLCAGRPILAAIPLENLTAKIIMETGSGRCVSPSDTIAFIKEAEAMRVDLKYREQSGVAGRKYAEENFDISKITDRFICFVDKIVGLN